MNIFTKITAAIAVAIALSGCARDSEVASHNISVESDSFRVPRRIVFYNGITDAYIMTLTGYCSIKDGGDSSSTGTAGTIAVICKDHTGIRKHYLHLSDNVTFFAEQLEPSQISVGQFEVVFKPSTVVPIIVTRGEK